MRPNQIFKLLPRETDDKDPAGKSDQSSKANPKKDPTLYRLIAYSNTEKAAIILLNTKTTCTPKIIASDILLNPENHGLRIILLEEDPSIHNKLSESEIPEKHRKHRDASWEIIRDLALDQTIIFDPTERWKRVNDCCRAFNKKPKVIYSYLRKYWQNGQTINALLPDYVQNTPKIHSGRKGRYTIKPDDLNIFESGTKIFIEGKSQSIRQAYKSIVFRYYSTEFKKNGSVYVPIIPKTKNFPTERQFRHWYNKNHRKIKTLKRVNEREFNLKYRGITGLASAKSFGPGMIYEIDSTIANINLVSTHDRNKIIGRPILYIIVDVFSWCIVGFYITLDPASYHQASIALLQAISEKTTFCKKFDIDIVSKEWPCQGIPAGLVADRGELISSMSNSIVNGLGIRLDNLPSYRADLKGFVERSFLIYDSQLFGRLPGGTNGKRKRGEIDPRIHSCLTLFDLYQLVIQLTLLHNNKTLQTYNPTLFSINEGVALRPNDLWNWGIENRTGLLRTITSEDTRFLLYPEGEASITEKGISFNGLCYTCKIAEAEDWFSRARVYNKTQKLKLRYDPQSVTNIHVKVANEYHKCTLLPAYSTFERVTWKEVNDHLKDIAKSKKDLERDDLQQEAKFNAHLEQIVSDAQSRTKNCPKQSKRSRLSQIKQNRKEESSALKDNAATTGSADSSSTSRKAKQVESHYIAPPSRLEMLKSRQRKLEDGDSK